MREIRISKGLRQVEVAERMDISQHTLSEMETERYPDYHMSTLRRWALALGVRHTWEIMEIPQEVEGDDE